MKLSFIVTSYNYEDYVLETIDSIKKQTYKDFEIIVVDDASSDNSVEKLKQVDGITLICHDKNEGQLASIITGLKVAQGEYISILDSDDTISQDYVQTLVNELENNDVAFVCCNGKKDETLTIKTAKIGGWYWSPMSCGMLKRAYLEAILDYKNTDLWRICPDKLLFNLAHLQGNSRNISMQLVQKREHGNNAGNTNFRFFVNLKNNFVIRHELNKILQNIEYKPLIDKSYTHILKQIINFCNRHK